MECIECKKSPHELDEYIEAAKEEDMEIEEYVRQEEGTYNKFIKDKFYCTMCYIKAGMPLYR
jgi:hypothetical protein